MKVAYALSFAFAALAISGCAQGGAQGGNVQTEGGMQGIALEFLYLQNCTYCTQYMPAVENAVGRFGGQVRLAVLDASLRNQDAQMAAKYGQYKKAGLFGGFPTLVANGNKSLVGLRSEEEVVDWLCGQFSQKPSACG